MSAAQRLASALTVSAPAATIMVVDDDRITRLHVSTLLEGAGYATTEQANGLTAYAALTGAQELPDAIVLDRDMPQLDGMGLLARLKSDARLSRIPIVMLTGSDAPEHIREGIAAGVFYYLTKPINAVVLPAVVGAAVDESRRRQSLLATLSQRQAHGQTSGQGIEILQLRLGTLAQAEQAATLLAPCFPQPEQALTGILELLVNAVEHGLLAIGYQAKSQLLHEGRWLAEVQRREALPDNRSRHVRVLFQRSDSGTCRLTVADPGTGFAWRNFLDLSPDRATEHHGRGIAKARAGSFQRLYFNETGNVVVAEADAAATLAW